RGFVYTRRIIGRVHAFRGVASIQRGRRSPVATARRERTCRSSEHAEAHLRFARRKEAGGIHRKIAPTVSRERAEGAPASLRRCRFRVVFMSFQSIAISLS